VLSGIKMIFDNETNSMKDRQMKFLNTCGPGFRYIYEDITMMFHFTPGFSCDSNYIHIQCQGSDAGIHHILRVARCTYSDKHIALVAIADNLLGKNKRRIDVI